jgi:hypothetical protein
MSLKLKKNLCELFAAVALMGAVAMGVRGAFNIAQGVNESIGFADPGTAASAVARTSEGVFNLFAGAGFFVIGGAFASAAEAYRRRITVQSLALKPTSATGGILNLH